MYLTGSCATIAIAGGMTCVVGPRPQSMKMKLLIGYAHLASVRRGACLAWSTLPLLRTHLMRIVNMNSREGGGQLPPTFSLFSHPPLRLLLPHQHLPTRR